MVSVVYEKPFILRKNVAEKGIRGERQTSKRSSHKPRSHGPRNLTGKRGGLRSSV